MTPMKKLHLPTAFNIFTSAIFILITFLSCGDNKEDLNPTFEVKYEIFTNSTFHSLAPNSPLVYITYTDQNGSLASEIITEATSQWNKTIKVKSDQPFEYKIIASGTTMTINGFVNIKVSANNQINSELNADIINTGLGLGNFQGNLSGIIKW